MEELIEKIARALVNRQDFVNTSRLANEGDKENYRLYVDPADRGKIIGRKGRTIKSFKIIIGAAAARQGRRASFEIVDDEFKKSRN